MKAPVFWYQQDQNPVSALLTPASKIVLAAGKWRQKFSSPTDLPLPVLCCGSITAGGAGKTPLARNIASHLKKTGFYPHFLSRGYQREKSRSSPKTLCIDSASPLYLHWKNVGDEPFLLSRTTPCWVDANRVRSGRLAHQAGADCLILDDGFQYPFLRKDLNLLIFKGMYGIGNGKILPAGPLRETLKDSVARADYGIIVGEDRFHLSKILNDFGIPCAHVTVSPSLNLLRKFRNRPISAFAGIAFPEDFFRMLRQAGLNLVKTYSFNDHYHYRKSDMDVLLKMADQYPVLTTLKDAVKFPPHIRQKFIEIDVEIKWCDPRQQDDIIHLLFQKYQKRMAAS